MMKICSKILVLAIVALFWCCNGDDTLLDLYPMEPVVNPEVGMLLEGGGMIHAEVDGRQQISGVAAAGIFSTADKFRSFDFKPQTWRVTDGVVAFGEGIVVHARTVGLSFALRYSIDNGSAWITYDGPIVGESVFAEGAVAAVQLSVAADGSVWVLCQQGGRRDQRVLLYRLDLEQQRSTLIMDKADATALTFGFAEPQHGWLLYGVPGERAGRVHVLRTEDGGSTWADGAVLDGMAQPMLTPVTADDLLVYSVGGTAVHSVDGGGSFEPVVVGDRVVACRAASPDVVFALLMDGIAKSMDGGRTWAVLDAFVHGVEVSGMALDFHDTRTGIAYGADRLFMTANGGQSWEVLVYPYDYLVEGSGAMLE